MSLLPWSLAERIVRTKTVKKSRTNVIHQNQDKFNGVGASPIAREMTVMMRSVRYPGCYRGRDLCVGDVTLCDRARCSSRCKSHTRASPVE